jgi:hypothetical protein
MLQLPMPDHFKLSKSQQQGKLIKALFLGSIVSWVRVA